MSNIKKVYILIVLQIFFLMKVYGGGFEIDPSSVRFNGYPCGGTFAANSILSMTYVASHYAFSGGYRRYEYLLFKLTNKTTGRNYYALQLGRDYLEKLSGFGDMQSLSYKLVLNLPDEAGSFQIQYFPLPLFTGFALGIIQYNGSITLDESSTRQISSFLKSQGEGNFKPLCSFIIAQDFKSSEKIPYIYLLLNNKAPGVRENVSAADTIIKFSWVVDNLAADSKALFRYRLFPEEEWSAWQLGKTVNYYFINKGMHEFQVECQYMANNKMQITNMSRYSFVLVAPLIVRPERINSSFQLGDFLEYIDKGDVKSIILPKIQTSGLVK